MSRSIRVIGSAAFAAFAVLSSSSSAYATTTFDTGMVTVMAQSRAVRVDVGGMVVVSVDKVSNPGVQVRVTADEGSQPVAASIHAAGENGCSAADNPAAGTLNRTVTVQGGPSTTLYLKVQYTTTTPIGVSSTTVLEPLGPTGLAVSGPAVVVGVPVDVCIA